MQEIKSKFCRLLLITNVGHRKWK